MRALIAKVIATLKDVFPTEREAYLFSRLGRAVQDDGRPHQRFRGEVQRVEQFVLGLHALRLSELPWYTEARPGKSDADTLDWADGDRA